MTWNEQVPQLPWVMHNVTRAVYASAVERTIIEEDMDLPVELGVNGHILRRSLH